MLGFLLRTAVRVVTLPVAVAHDVVTLAGAANDSRPMVYDTLKAPK